LQPSILIWLAAIFGNTHRIAEVGAISRIGQLIALVGFGLELFVVPYLASLREERAFRRSYTGIWFVLCTIGSVVFVAAMTLRKGILFLLGPNYTNLDTEFVLVTAIALLNVAVNYAVIVNRLRAWNKLEPLCTLVQFIGQAVLIAWLPLDSTAEILMVGLC